MTKAIKELNRSSSFAYHNGTAYKYAEYEVKVNGEVKEKDFYPSLSFVSKIEAKGKAKASVIIKLTCPHCGNPLIKRAKTKLWFSLHFISDIICIATVLLFAIFDKLFIDLFLFIKLSLVKILFF